MLYLFLGENTPSKDEKILNLKNEYIQSPIAASFDFEVLYAQKLSPEELKKSLVTLPSVSKKRVILIHEIDKLNEHNQGLILEALEESANSRILILESEKAELTGAWGKKITALAKVFAPAFKTKLNAFDMTRAISTRNPAQALDTLSQLFEAGDHPLQVMGALVWFWGKERSRLSGEGYKKGLQVLQEADMNIKRSKIGSEEALEVAIVKLTQLV